MNNKKNRIIAKEKKRRVRIWVIAAIVVLLSGAAIVVFHLGINFNTIRVFTNPVGNVVEEANEANEATTEEANEAASILSPKPIPTAAPGMHYCLNAAEPLSVKDYTGMNQPMHPKVIYFSKGWNGYKYWMSYTPYPQTNPKFENPSLAVSNDGIKWTTPKGLHNPVVKADADVNHGSHNSDSQIVMVGSTMQLWYRYNPANTNKPGHPNNDINVISMISSTNGIDWSSPKMIFSDKIAYLSPDILYENGLYKVWYTDYDGIMYYKQSADLVSWINAQQVNLHVPGFRIWHQDMIRGKGGYETVFCAYKKGNFITQMFLFYAKSADGMNFSNPELILGPSQNKNSNDNALVYRSSLVDIDGQYKVYYSAMNTKHQWHIFISDLYSR